MAYTAPKGGPSLGFRYMKGWEVQQLKYEEGREICHFGLTSYPRGGYSLYYGLYGEALPGRRAFFRLQVHEMVASPTVEVCGRVWTFVISVILSTPGGRVLPTLWSKRGGSAPKGRPFLGVRYVKGWGDQQLKSVEG